MKPILRQFLNLLASANFDNRQIREILLQLMKTPQNELLSEIENIQNSFGSKLGRSPSSTESPSDFFSDRVVELLITQAGYSKSEAHYHLNRMLQTIFPSRKIPSLSPKSGFAAWLKLLRKSYSESELLHVATRIRNERVHGAGDKDDWLHRKGEV